MKNKILGIFVCMLLIAAAVLPVTGTMNEKENSLTSNIVENISIFERLSKNLFKTGSVPNLLLKPPYYIDLISDTSSDHSSNPSVAVDVYGTAHVVWQDKGDLGETGPDIDIFYKYKPDGGSWSNVLLVSEDSDQDSQNPSIAVDLSGFVHVVWQDDDDITVNYDPSGSDTDIFYRYRDTYWHQIELVSHGSDDVSEQASIVVDEDYNIHVVWNDHSNNFHGSGSDSDIFYRFSSGGIWDPIELVDDDSTGDSCEPSIDIDNNWVVHVAWSDETDFDGGGSDDDNDKDIFYINNDGGTWSGNLHKMISEDSSGSSEKVSLKIGPANQIYIAWSDDSPNYHNSGNDRDIFFRETRILGWTSIKLISENSNAISNNASLSVCNWPFGGGFSILWEDGSNLISNSGPDIDIFEYGRLYAIPILHIGSFWWDEVNLTSMYCDSNSYNPSQSFSNHEYNGIKRSCIVWEDESDYDGPGSADDNDRDIFGRSYTPGFELVLFIGALAISLIILRKRKLKL